MRPGSDDARRDARALARDRVLGDLDDEALPFLDEVVDARAVGLGRRRSRPVGVLLFAGFEVDRMRQRVLDVEESVPVEPDRDEGRLHARAGRGARGRRTRCRPGPSLPRRSWNTSTVRPSSRSATRVSGGVALTISSLLTRWRTGGTRRRGSGRCRERSWRPRSRRTRRAGAECPSSAARRSSSTR